MTRAMDRRVGVLAPSPNIFNHMRCKFFISIFIGLNFVLLLRKFDFCFGFWAEGSGVNAQNPKLLIGLYFSQNLANQLHIALLLFISYASILCCLVS